MSIFRSTPKAQMSYKEFLEKLKKLPIKWEITKVFGRECIVSVQTREWPVALFSPTTAVFKDITGKFIYVDDRSTAVNCIPLPSGLGMQIGLAEAGHVESFRSRTIRHDLLEATGLEEPKPSQLK